MSGARQTERRREQHVLKALADIVGEEEATRLMDASHAYPYPGEGEPRSPVLKVRRLSASARGRARLAKAKTWDDVPTI